MRKVILKDTLMNLQTAIQNKTREKLFVSLATKPGTTGVRFYTRLFEMHGVNAEYVACECTDLARDITLVREYCAGASVTMPYKQQVLNYIDVNYSAFTPVNTILNDRGFLSGYNCDLLGLTDLIHHQVQGKTVNILGSGAMSKNVKIICADQAEFCKIYSRKHGNWAMRNTNYDVLINTTSIGMDGEECPINPANVSLVVDCVIGNTPLIQRAAKHGSRVISGNDIYLAQLRYQFKLYTGISLDTSVLKDLAKTIW